MSLKSNVLHAKRDTGKQTILPGKKNHTDQAHIILPVMKSNYLLATSHLCMDHFPCMEIT